MMTKKRHKHYLLGTFIYSLITSAYAAEIGPGAAFYSSPFRGDENSFIPWPIIDIDTGYFFVKNFTAGIHLSRDTDQQINLIVQYLPLHLKPSKNSNDQMKLLNQRRPTLLAGVGYKLVTNFGDLDATILGDTLDNSRSLISTLDYSYHISLNQEATVSPVVGTAWVNKKHNQYYYGINVKESRQTGFPIYNPNDGFNYYAGFDLKYSFDENWATHINYRYLLLKDKVQSSPITKHDHSHLLMLGLSFTF